MDRINAFLDGLPGYSDYRDLESRRDIDRRLRESIANQIDTIAQRAERGGAALVANQRYSDATKVERLVQSLRHAGNLVRTQSYGYGGIFTDTPVGERALNQLYLFDKGLGLKVDQLDQQLADIQTSITSGVSLDETLTAAETAVQGIIDSLATRGAVIESAAPAVSRSLFTPLDEPAKNAPPPPIGISVGDAIGWFDEDFLVDAIIDIKNGQDRVRFFHIGQDPDRWLAVVDRDERIIAILDEGAQNPGSAVAGQWTLSGTGKTERAGTKPMSADAQVTYYEGEGENVSFRLLSGADERYLTGKRVHPDDLAIYGKPAKS